MQGSYCSRHLRPVKRHVLSRNHNRRLAPQGRPLPARRTASERNAPLEGCLFALPVRSVICCGVGEAFMPGRCRWGDDQRRRAPLVAGTETAVVPSPRLPARSRRSDTKVIEVMGQILTGSLFGIVHANMQPRRPSGTDAGALPSYEMYSVYRERTTCVTGERGLRPTGCGIEVVAAWVAPRSDAAATRMPG